MQNSAVTRKFNLALCNSKVFSGLAVVDKTSGTTSLLNVHLTRSVETMVP